VVAITHDRYFLDNVAGWILELDRGQGIPWKGNYSSGSSRSSKRLAQEEKAESNRQRTLARELEWVQMSPKARQAKSKARVKAYEDLLSQAASNDKRVDTTEIVIPFTGKRLGNIVVEAKKLKQGLRRPAAVRRPQLHAAARRHRRHHRPQRRRQDHAVSHDHRPGEARQRRAQDRRDGRHRRYVDQSRDALDPDKKIYQEISGGQEISSIGGRDVNARAYVSKFNFNGADQQKKVGVLSGGERNRVHLASCSRRAATCCCSTSRPTTSTSTPCATSRTRCSSFPGCAVVISHDRWFLDRIATHILAFEGDSKVVWFEGNYEDYEADKKRRLGEDALTPHRIKYRKLTLS
jgi:sulfate-transporting ATPase